MSRWYVRVLVSLTVVSVLLAFVPLDEVWEALGRARPWVWAASLGIFAAGHVLNALKLRLLIGPAFAPVAPCVRAQFAGLVANLGLPGVAGGDLVRGAYLAPTAGLKRVTLAAVADRILDTVVLLLVVVAALPFAGMPQVVADLAWRGGWWIVAGGLGGVGLAVAAVVVLRRLGLGRHLDQARADLRNRVGSVAAAVTISLLVQPAFVLTNVWLAHEVGVTTGLAAWFVAWPASKLVAVLPISLGGIGVREAALVTLLASYGAPADGVLAAGILWEAVLIVGGLAGLFVTQTVRRQVERTTGPEEGNA